MSSLEQNLYCFISGKNWKLSLAEIVAFFESRNISFQVEDFNKDFFALKTSQPIDSQVIDELGGTLKIGEATTTLPTSQLAKAFVKEDKQAKEQLQDSLPLDVLADNIPRADSGKTVFGVSVYSFDPTFRHASKVLQRFLGSRLKDELRNQGKKARFMGFPRNRSQPHLTPVEVLKKGLDRRSEILLCIGNQQSYLGATVGVHNPFEFQKRDVEKPMQRKIFAIPPRLAKIMVNLSHCTAGKVFLDPFCGVGTILQEALLAKAKVIGLDINRWCVEASRQNLSWLTREYSFEDVDVDYAVLQGDARKLTSKLREEIDCIATEPDLGPALQQFPTTPYAQKILQKIKPAYEDFLSEAYQILRENGYLVLVAPYIKVRSGKPLTLNIQETAVELGFKPAQIFAQTPFVDIHKSEPLRPLTSFIDAEERHKIGREICILQK
ncbi:MAG: DNA methyltransferase [Candidatus Bathyarchaeota archaeon]|nr:DNA methyltransferase [Candidatus Bathyarchaeota archaeon]